MAGTVTVGCKIPNGLILEVGNTRVTLNGANSSNIIGGHGITEGVDQDFFEAWMQAHDWLPAVKNGFVFAHTKPANAQAEAKEKADETTGLEPLDPKKTPAGITLAKSDE